MWNPFRSDHDTPAPRSREWRGSHDATAAPPRYDLGDRNPSQGFTGGYGGAVSPRHADDAGGSYAASHFPAAPGQTHAPADHTSFAGRGPRNWQRSDARIEEDVCDALMHHPAVDASELEVRVENGEVTLSGEVEDRRTKRLAEEIVEQCAGVHDVHNRLRARRSRFEEAVERLGNVRR
jgi:hypothetical protein